MLAAIAKRLGMILLGYGAACLAAGIATWCLSVILGVWRVVGVEDGYAAESLEELLLFAMIIAIYMAIPTILTVPFLEARKVRNPTVYGLLGAVWSTFMFLLIFKALQVLTLVVALSGVIAGLVYWAVAGRSAGQVWR